MQSVSLHSTVSARSYTVRHFRDIVRLTDSLWSVPKCMKDFRSTARAVENEKNTVKAGKKSYIERGVEKMNRHEEIKNAYKSLGGDATFYDGMITCSTLSGKAVCKLVWNIRTRRPAGKMMSQRPGTIHR